MLPGIYQSNKTDFKSEFITSNDINPLVELYGRFGLPWLTVEEWRSNDFMAMSEIQDLTDCEFNSDIIWIELGINKGYQSPLHSLVKCEHVLLMT